MPRVSRRGRRSVSRRPRRARGSVSRRRRGSVSRRGQGFLSELKQSLTRSSARPKKTTRTQRRPTITRNRKRQLAPLPKYRRTQSPERRFSAPAIMSRTTQHKPMKQFKVTGV